MKVNTVTEAKAQLSALIERVLKGEEIIIARAGKPVAVLVPFEAGKRPRTPGRWKGEVQIADDFDTLPPDIAEAFGMETP
jgi:prevent-host-death family protein